MGKYTAEQKLQLLSNLDLETTHRIQRLETWLTDHLGNFKLRQEGLLAHIPKSLRNMTMRDFAKYDGDIKRAAQGVQAQNYGKVEAIDRTTRKRKWIESQEQEQELAAKAGISEDGVKPLKNARMTAATPKKPSTLAPNAGRTRLPNPQKTPSALRTAHHVPSGTTPSPHKPTVPRPLPSAFPSSRPASPTKSRIPFPTPSKPRPPTAPSTSQFNPSIPGSSASSYPRWPRKGENMLSVNGSPLANPLNLDLSTWLSRNREAEDDEPGGMQGKSAGAQGRQRTNSIVVRSTTPGLPHSRSNTGPQSKKPVFAPARTAAKADAGEQPVAAVVSVPTADGHLLEFDPFRTSPGEIDALEGITNSAKKQAKEDMRSLVKQAAERWRIE